MSCIKEDTAAKPCPNPITVNSNKPGIKKSPNGESPKISIGIPNLVPSGCNIIRNPAGIADTATMDWIIPTITDIDFSVFNGNFLELPYWSQINKIKVTYM